MNHPWLDALLEVLVNAKGSDLHLKGGSQPRVRIDGRIQLVSGPGMVSEEQAAEVAYSIMPIRVAESFNLTHEADFAYTAAGLGRFRVNTYRQRGSVGMVFRAVRNEIPELKELGLPAVVGDLADHQRGLVLVTGPTGSGKTTTLAAMVDRINRTRECNIVTIEDPIEFIHADRLATISQREVGLDTKGFTAALRSAMRQDPDVILVGEMRDPETVDAALTAAETGHLVFSTLHTIDAPETVNRIIDMFPPHQQPQARASLAGSLRGVISQRLVRRCDGLGRLPAIEVLVANGRVQACILDPKRVSEIGQMLAEGGYYGMRSFDQSIRELFADGLISLDEAMAAASRPHDLRVVLEREGLVPTGA